jgi:hypothetical protein
MKCCCLKYAGTSPQSSSPEIVSNIQSQTTLQNWKTITKTSQQGDSRGTADRSLILPQKKGMRQINNPPVNQHTKNATQKQDNWWATKLISRTWRKHKNLNCHTSLRKEMMKQLPLKHRIKKTLPYHLVRLGQRFCLNTNTRAECWKNNTKT